MYPEVNEGRIRRFRRAAPWVLLAERERWGQGTNILQNPHWVGLAQTQVRLLKRQEMRCTATLACSC